MIYLSDYFACHRINISQEVTRMANPRVYAGFYKRYDGKIVYVISTAKDTDTGEEPVIFINYDYFTAISYGTITPYPMIT